ncbi:MAG TPA: substrate-binding domain-containing protein [Tepidisphaeraceae bacterium]|nr:substrate-binding domain-containing protein [Tepidisphaeraceae bacterium]
MGVVVDGASTYGRSILRGVTRYANLQRKWILHKSIRPVPPGYSDFPNCDGVVVGGVPWIVEFAKPGTYLVSCSGGTSPKQMPVVSLDDEAAGAMAAEHLVDCRLRHFAFYGLQRASATHDRYADASGKITLRHRPIGPSPVALNRLKGFRAALNARGFDCSECPVDWPSTEQWTTHPHRAALIEWLKSMPRPLGVLASDDSVAHDLADACLAGGIGVPDHVAIIGVNNDDLLCEGAWPPLSSVDADFARMGYGCAKLLDRLFAGEKLTEEERLTRLPPVRVVQRQSTNVLAVGDPNLADAIRFIREHACDPCSVEDVLRVVPVGRRWLERQFVTHLGRTPHEEIARVRVETARRLLLEPDLTLPTIADRCGFSTLANFHRAFRIQTDSTPAAFRRDALRGMRSAGG